MTEKNKEGKKEELKQKEEDRKPIKEQLKKPKKISDEQAKKTAKELEEIKKKEEKPMVTYHPTSTDEKIKALMDFEHIEELFYTLNILKDKEVKQFLEHYKNSDISPTNDKKVDLIVRNSENHYKLKDNIRDEIVSSLDEEIQELKSRMSALTKKGKDTYVEMIKLMTAPLKIKIFKATGKKDDFYKAKKIVSSVEETIKPKEEELEKELKQQEQEEKEREEKEKKVKEEKEKIRAGKPTEKEEKNETSRDKPSESKPNTTSKIKEKPKEKEKSEEKENPLDLKTKDSKPKDEKEKTTKIS